MESEVHEVERGMWRVRGEERERERGAGGSQRGGEKEEEGRRFLTNSFFASSCSGRTLSRRRYDGPPNLLGAKGRAPP